MPRLSAVQQQVKADFLQQMQDGRLDKAVDDGAEGEGRLTRERGQGLWSPSGVYGQATLASAEKGRVIAKQLLDHVLTQIANFQTRA